MKKRNYFSDIEDRNENSFSVIADFEGNEEQLMDVEVDEILPVLPLRNMVLFPGVFMPVSVGRKSSLKLVREAEKKGTYIAVVCQKVADTEAPLYDDLHTIGTVAKIVRVLEMPDQTTTVILQGSKRIELKEITETTPYLKGRINTLNEEIPAKDDKEFQALVEACKDLTVRYIKSSDMFPQDSAFAIKNISNPMFLVDFICTNLPLKKDEKIELLRIDALRARTYRLLEILNREVQLAEIKESIQMRAREDIDQQQREYFLQQQIKTIQDDVSATVNIAITASFALIISVYMSLSTESLGHQARTLVCAYLKPAHAAGVLKFCRLFRQSFANFLTGQCSEAVILGVLMALAFSVFKIPYGSLVGVLTAICAIIPYVGALISCVVSVFLVLLVDPVLAVRCLIVYLAVQFVENQFIYPRVVGKSVGLSPLYTLIAAMIGGKLFGIIGIIFFIPLTAVVIELVKEDTFRRLRAKEPLQ